MGIRILCLHGQGVNGSIFRRQTENIRGMLPCDYEFFFFDGAYHCSPAPGVLDYFAPPYLTWYTTPTVDKVLDAHQQVRRCVDQHGPFDIVMGFSQGAAVAASLLLHQELESETPLFKAAIFIGSPIPFSYRTDVGIDTRKYFGVQGGAKNPHGRPTVIPPYLSTDPEYLRNPVQLGELISFEEIRYQMFHPTTDAVRMRIPTGHIYGTRDKWFLHSKDLAGLCCANLRTVFVHDGGHEIPKDYAEEICDLIETVSAKI